MSTATRPHRPLSQVIGVPSIREVHAPAWFNRLPTWLTTGGIVVVLMAISLVLRTRQLSGQLWFNEGIAVGVAQHSLGDLFGLVRDAGGSPLYYLLLHFWVTTVGSSAAEAHWLSELFALLAIPAAMWVGQSLGGRRAGIFAAILFAFSSYMTQFSEEAQPYELLVLLSLLTTAGFVHGFVYRRRRYLWLFAAGLTAMLYTQLSAGLYAFGAACALVLVWWAARTEDRGALARDAVVCFVAVALLYVPWLPTTIHQIGHATSPWHYTPLVGAALPSQITGGDRVDVTLLVALLVGCVPMMVAARRRSPEAVTIWALAVLVALGILLGRLGSVAGPSWVYRYFGVMVAPVLLLAALGIARAKVVGVIAIALCIAFCANPNSFAPGHKSDMQQVAAQLGPMLHRGDAVAIAQPEQAPLAYYYLPSDLRWSSTLGPISTPSAMNWNDAYSRLRDAAPAATIGGVVASLKPGQQLLIVRPLTEGVMNWKAPWTELVRRRAAQWGQILTKDVADGTLRQVAIAPANYPSACCVASSAVLYQKAQ
ncbi:MAG TPA: glycosyltransferase family 39 protein [Solirubrobacteraceae bacterium]|nr:glycosyltransferase family 39 protein [Solirubrobacteraceae bacterium]